ncbi:type II toxin-antitoxin system antitoxin SocA domain-containing protein [Campylobacter sp. RM12651]|uniref:Panacea domain-containing protein n=1 Tax=Campylobacter sp. RM12651 TaxID=1660079 RepID=UPI001EFAF40F|nr:type II toxin-antitoxin system antitoxin SocA domain-containing protein [Campylobacter sp. RM12651]ULO03791.1 DUF4065 domain-containing protein [Campylobacter sp. RM12651]
MKDIDIAKYIIYTMHQKGCPISNLQLQKILYFAHVESNATLLKEKFEAWKNGPVLRNIYNEFRHYSAEKIVNITTLEVLPNKEEKEILDNVIQAFIKLGAWNIVLLAHSEQLAWRKTTNDFINNDGSWNEKKYKENFIKNGCLYIDNKLIKKDKNKIYKNQFQGDL